MYALSFNSVSFKARKNRREIMQIISQVIDSGIFLNGPRETKLIKSLQNYFGAGLISATASGHDAISITLSALKLKKSDEIIFPVNAYPVAFPVALSGACPVPVDVDENGQLDINLLKKKLSRKTKAIILVHLYGLVGNLTGIQKIVKKKNIILIEDSAQAFGSRYKNRLVGTLGDIGCFSFYPTKNLGALGDGGAIWTKNKKFYQFFLKASSYGEKKRYVSEFISGHSRLPEIQAGVLNLYLKEIKKDIIKRNNVYKYYVEKINKQNLSKFIRILISHPESQPVRHLFVIEVINRNGLKKFLEKRKIPVLIHYPKPVHLVTAFDFLKFKKGDFPMAERLSNNCLSLPFHEYLTKKQIDYIIESIKTFYYG